MLIWSRMSRGMCVRSVLLMLRRSHRERVAACPVYVLFIVSKSGKVIAANAPC